MDHADNWLKQPPQPTTRRFVEQRIPTWNLHPHDFEAILSYGNKIRLAWIGTGDLALRFAAKAFHDLCRYLPELEGKVEIVCVDTAGYRADGQEDKDFGCISQSLIHDRLLELQRRGFPVTRYYHCDDYKNLLREGKEEVHIIYLALPPALHVREAEEYLNLTPPDVVVAVEKPIARPAELAQMRTLVQTYPGRVVDVDFFTTSTAFHYLVATTAGQSILTDFGVPDVISGSLLETQMVESHRLGGNDGLRRPAISGGGMLLDCGVHTLALASVFMDQWMVQLSQIATDLPGGYLVSAADGLDIWQDCPWLTNPLAQVYMASYDGREDLAETYAAVQIQCADVTMQFQAGKGTNVLAYTLDCYSHEGNRLLVGLGTESHPPFLQLEMKNSYRHLLVFESEGFAVGYDLAFHRLLSYYVHRKSTLFPPVGAGLRAALGAVDVCKRAAEQAGTYGRYEVGTMPPISFFADADAGGKVPPFQRSGQ